MPTHLRWRCAPIVELAWFNAPDSKKLPFLPSKCRAPETDRPTRRPWFTKPADLVIWPAALLPAPRALCAACWCRLLGLGRLSRSWAQWTPLPRVVQTSASPCATPQTNVNCLESVPAEQLFLVQRWSRQRLLVQSRKHLSAMTGQFRAPPYRRGHSVRLATILEPGGFTKLGSAANPTPSRRSKDRRYACTTSYRHRRRMAPGWRSNAPKRTRALV